MDARGWCRARGRGRVAGLVAATAWLALTGASAQTTPKSPDGLYTEQELEQMEPSSPNPYLAFLPSNVEPDWPYWRSTLHVQAAKLSPAPLPRSTRVVNVGESEPNDTLAEADFIATLGTGLGDDSVASLSGTFSEPLPPGVFTPKVEDDGSITLAGTVPVSAGQSVGGSAQIGDGPHGSSGTGNGDFDFYKLENVQAGQLIEADIDADVNSLLDSYLALWDSSGALLAVNDDDPRTSTLDSYLRFSAPATGDYYISVGSFLSPIPLDPFDSSSGLGVGSEGGYSIFIGLEGGGKDLDYFSFDAEAGDIIGVSASGAATNAALVAPDGTLLVDSAQNVASIYPSGSPLPNTGNAVLAYVAPAAGSYGVRFLGAASGAWNAEVRLFRPPLEDTADARQILFLDFDGAMVDTGIFGGTNGVVSLSPLSAFLSDWGLSPGDENAVIDAIVGSVEENLRLDLIENGLAGSYDIEIRNSRDHPDPFGQANVSRVIVGGTIDETGIFTIGISQSIDIGNFNRQESALVLLDTLSGPDFDPNSLNWFFLAPGTTKIDLVGTGVGNIAAHEAGHFFGNFHTENQVTPPNIMDKGGDLSNLIGAGFDHVFGSGDDTDVDFGEDFYEPTEGFAGTEDTLNAVAFGLQTLLDLNELYVDLDATTIGIGTSWSPLNQLSDAITKANSNALIRIFSSSAAETFSAGNSVTKPLFLINQSPGSGKVTIGQEN